MVAQIEEDYDDCRYCAAEKLQATLPDGKNREQVVVETLEIMDDVEEQFGYLDPSEEKEELEQQYIEENYPVFLEQKKQYDFAAPIIEFLHKEFSEWAAAKI